MSGGNNMESLLMGDDDSSSGESDGEHQVNVPTGETAASTVAVSRPAPAPPAAAPPALTVTAPPTAGRDAQSDQMARLKSLYQQQPKRPAPTPNSGASTPQTSNRSSVVPPQQQQPQQPPQMQPYHQAPPPHGQQQHQVSARSLPPNRPHPQATPQLQAQYQQVPPSQQQYHRSSSSSSQPRVVPTGVADPFAPTPLNRIKERQQHQMQQQPPQQQQQHQQHVAPPPQQHQGYQPQQEQQAQLQPGRAVDPQDRAAMARELRRQKEKFLMFTRVLIKYLEQKDPTLHQKAKLIIKDCADRNRRQERGYESVTAAMKERLKALVGDNYWKRAEIYLKHFLEQKKKQQQQQEGDGAPRAATVSVSTNSAAALAQQQQQQAMQEKQRNMQLAQQQKAQQQQQQQQQQQEPPQQQQQVVTTPTIQQVQRDIATQKAKVAAAGGKGKSVGKKAVKRKSTPSSAASRKAAATAASPPPVVASPKAVDPVDHDNLPPREYNELMKLVDHAIDFDWTTAGLLLGSKMDLQLTDEQQILLYGDMIATKTQKAEEETLASGIRPGWSSRNIVSARNAWAAVRLREIKQMQKDQSSHPVVGDIGLTLPQVSKSATEAVEVTTWINEDHAEEDVVLAMLSEGTEIYLRGVLEKAIHCARQRQNLDGIRLWHQQSTYAVHQEKADGEEDDGQKKPALSLRLGCDVERQQAQAAGNAAMVVKRMEQALERQSSIPARARVLEGETLSQATSMSDLAMRPQLAKGVEMADHHGKRQFEIYGGKDATEPPLGRVPKAAKLEVADFMMGSRMNESVGRHFARNAAASIFF